MYENTDRHVCTNGHTDKQTDIAISKCSDRCMNI